MTKKEKIELGKLLDKHRIKSIYYTEVLPDDITTHGVYFILRRANDDTLIDDNIKGINLE